MYADIYVYISTRMYVLFVSELHSLFSMYMMHAKLKTNVKKNQPAKQTQILSN